MLCVNIRFFFTIYTMNQMYVSINPGLSSLGWWMLMTTILGNPGNGNHLLLQWYIPTFNSPVMHSGFQALQRSGCISPDRMQWSRLEARAQAAVNIWESQYDRQLLIRASSKWCSRNACSELYYILRWLCCCAAWYVFPACFIWATTKKNVNKE